MTLFPEILQRWLVTDEVVFDEADVFPILPGQTLLTGKAPMWSTSIATSTSGRERRRSNWSYPRWRIKTKYEVLRARPSQPELARLYAFFCLHMGQREPFHFYDPYDHQVTDEIIGIGDGSRTRFQLVRRLYTGPASFVEPVRRALQPVIMIDQVAVTDFTVTDEGEVVLATPPASGAVVSWSGRFLFRCRFNSDEMDPEQMTRDLWSLSGVELLTVKR